MKKKIVNLADLILLEMLIEHLSDVPDPRLDRKKKHPLMGVLGCILCGILAGCNGLTDIEMFCIEREEWLETVLDLPNGIPSHDTMGRVLALIDSHALEAALIHWSEELREQRRKEGELEILAIDGKACRGSQKQGNKALHLLNAYVINTEGGLVIGQIEAGEKTNEIGVAPDLIEQLNLKETIVTMDALLTQKSIAEKIVKKGGYYFLAVKENQKGLYEDIELLMRAIKDKKEDEIELFAKTIEKNRGRIETRRCWLSAEITQCPEAQGWIEVKNAVMVERKTEQSNKETEIEKRYFITNIEKEALTLLEISRKHWSIENSLHHVLDVTFLEDASQIYNKQVARNLGVFRKIALNMLSKVEGKKKNMSQRSKRKVAGWSTQFLEKCLIGG